MVPDAWSKIKDTSLSWISSHRHSGVQTERKRPSTAPWMLSGFMVCRASVGKLEGRSGGIMGEDGLPGKTLSTSMPSNIIEMVETLSGSLITSVPAAEMAKSVLRSLLKT